MKFTIRDMLWLMVPLAANEVAAQQPGPTLKELLSQPKDADGNRSVLWMAREQAAHHQQPRLGLSNRLLIISWWKDRIMVLQYTVTDDGAYESVRETPRAQQANHRKTIVEEELKRLRELFPTLPESKAEPPIERTVLVSFQSGDKWRTETYDATKLPDEFEKVMLIIGERFETKDRHKK